MGTCFSVTRRNEEFDATKRGKNEKVLLCVGRADLALRARQGEIFKESASHHESEDRAIRRYDLESSYNLDVRGTRKPFVHGKITKVHYSDLLLQQDKRAIRAIRAEQIERLVGTKASVMQSIMCQH